MPFSGPENPKNYLLSRASWHISNAWFLRPMQVSPQTAYRSVQPFLQDSRTRPTDKHTDRQTNLLIYSVCSNRPHLAIAAMRQYVACLSLSPLCPVSWSHGCAVQNGWTDRDAVCGADSCGPKEPCITWGSRSPATGRGNFGICPARW